MITCQDYNVADPDALETPAMLLYQDMMHHNIRSVCEMAGGGENLIVHVKTHKSEAVARKQVEAGIDGFKCATLNELAMVLRAGARRAILSYPQGQERKIERLCDLASSYPGAWIATVVSTPFHVEVLGHCGRTPKTVTVHDAGPGHRTPHVAILVFAGLTCVLAISGAFTFLAVASSASLLLIYLGCSLAVFRLRRRDVGGNDKVFRAPGGPVVPAASCLIIVWLLSHVTAAEAAVLRSILVAAALYYIVRRKRVTF